MSKDSCKNCQNNKYCPYHANDDLELPPLEPGKPVCSICESGKFCMYHGDPVAHNGPIDVGIWNPSDHSHLLYKEFFNPNLGEPYDCEITFSFTIKESK